MYDTGVPIGKPVKGGISSGGFSGVAETPGIKGDTGGWPELPV